MQLYVNQLWRAIQLVNTKRGSELPPDHIEYITITNEPQYPLGWIDSVKLEDTVSAPTLMFQNKKYSYKYRSGLIEHHQEWVFIGIAN